MAYNEEQLDGKLDDHVEVKEEPILQCYVKEERLPSFESISVGPASVDVVALNLWTSKATTCLINQYKKYRSLVGKSPRIRSLREMFEMISLEMQNHGFSFSPQKCENKWRVLVRKYKNIAYRERLKKPGRIQQYGQWEHKRALDEIFNGEKKKHVYIQETDSQPPNESAAYGPSILTGRDRDGDPLHPLKVHQREDHVSANDATSEKDEGASDYKKTLTALFEKFTEEIRKSFAQAERNEERRHKEKLAVKQKELELKKQLLKLKEQKMQLQKCQMIAAARSFK